MYKLYLYSEAINHFSYHITYGVLCLSILCGIMSMLSKNDIIAVFFLIGLILNLSSYFILSNFNFIEIWHLLSYIGAFWMSLWFGLIFFSLNIWKWIIKYNVHINFLLVLGIILKSSTLVDIARRALDLAYERENHNRRSIKLYQGHVWYTGVGPRLIIIDKYDNSGTTVRNLFGPVGNSVTVRYNNRVYTGLLTESIPQSRAPSTLATPLGVTPVGISTNVLAQAIFYYRIRNYHMHYYRDSSYIFVRNIEQELERV